MKLILCIPLFTALFFFTSCGGGQPQPVVSTSPINVPGATPTPNITPPTIPTQVPVNSGEKIYQKVLNGEFSSITDDVQNFNFKFCEKDGGSWGPFKWTTWGSNSIDCKFETKTVYKNDTEADSEKKELLLNYMNKACGWMQKGDVVRIQVCSGGFWNSVERIIEIDLKKPLQIQPVYEIYNDNRAERYFVGVAK